MDVYCGLITIAGCKGKPFSMKALFYDSTEKFTAKKTVNKT